MASKIFEEVVLELEREGRIVSRISHYGGMEYRLSDSEIVRKRLKKEEIRRCKAALFRLVSSRRALILRRTK